MITRSRFVIVLSLLVSVPVALRGQTVSRDEATGDFLVQYSLDGKEYVARVPSGDRIAPVVTLTGLQPTNSGFTYTYRVSNLSSESAIRGRGIFMIGVPCSGVDSSASPPTSAPPGWHGTVVGRSSGAPVCRFLARPSSALEPGDSVGGISVSVRLLPSVGRVSVAGVFGQEEIPTGEETPDTIYSIINSLQRKVVWVQGVVPGRAPSTDPVVLGGYLNDDLSVVCGAAGGIDNEGICHSLQAKLAAARSSLARGQIVPGQNQLKAFEAELDAQRDKHISDSAYLLLSAITNRLIGSLR